MSEGCVIAFPGSYRDHANNGPSPHARHPLETVALTALGVIRLARNFEIVAAGHEVGNAALSRWWTNTRQLVGSMPRISKGRLRRSAASRLG